MATRAQDVERERLAQAAQRKADWRRFGPYLTERQWGTIREDYSANGDAWSSFPHEHARSRAYRWGEDGLLGICDDQGFLYLALVLWNEKDPILKERLFGVANPEGNHGEDVKECYYYLDATPTASYLKALYKYPQAAFPYAQLVSVNRARSKAEPEYELLDTGIFDGNRYFDVFVEYAKAAPDDILVRITAHNRGPARAPLHLLPTLWFRNTWSWKGGIEEDIPKPAIRLAGRDGVVAEHARLGRLNLVAAAALGTVDGPRWMFTENETNVQRLYGQPNPSPYVKDGFHAAVVEHRADAVHPEGGTKCAAHFRADVPAGGNVELRLRLSPRASSPAAALREGFDEVLGARRHLHAGQVGVPLVRGLGSRLPHLAVRLPRPGLRARPAPAHAARVVHGPVRPARRVRVRLRRREPAGPRLGVPEAVDLRNGAGRGRRRLPAPRVPEAPHELRLVGEPEGPGGREPLHGGLPGDGQHRHLRSEREAPRRRSAGAVGRDGVDGLLLQRDAGHHHRAGARRSPLRGDGEHLPPALRVDLRGAERSRRALGRGGGLLPRSAPLRRPPAAAQGSVAGRAHAARRRRLDPGGRRAGGRAPPAARAHRSVPVVPQPGPGSRGAAGAGRTPDADLAPLARAARSTRATLPDHVRRAGVPVAARDAVDVPHPPRAPCRDGSRGAALRGALPAGRVGQLDVRRELQLARTGLDAAQRAVRRGAIRLSPVLR